MVSKSVFIAGATGYIGTHLVSSLRKGGYSVTCMSRHQMKNTDSCSKFVRGDITHPDSWLKSLEGHDVVINLVGIIRENPETGAFYAKVHVEGTLNLLRGAKDAGINRYIHISALGVEKGVTPYQRTKYAAESAVRQSNLNWTIFRPSIVLGHDDRIVSMLRKYMKFFRIIPYFSGKLNEFNLQPVFIDDLVRGIVLSIENPATYERIFEVAGPERVTYRELLLLVSKTVPGPVFLVPFPFHLARWFFETMDRLIPSPMTAEQLDLLRLGSVSDNWEEFYRFFDFNPTPLREYIGV